MKGQNVKRGGFSSEHMETLSIHVRQCYNVLKPNFKEKHAWRKNLKSMTVRDIRAQHSQKKKEQNRRKEHTQNEKLLS